MMVLLEHVDDTAPEPLGLRFVDGAEDPRPVPLVSVRDDVDVCELGRLLRDLLRGIGMAGGESP